MMHDLQTEPRDGRYYHVCRRCGAKKTTRTQRWFGECKIKLPPCIHLGAATGDFVTCDSCKGTVRIKTFGCGVHGVCLPDTIRAKVTTPEVHRCDGCESRT